MNQNERRIYLIQELIKEDERYQGMEIPDSVEDQKDLLRALMNVRLPNPISDSFLKVQDAYLKEELKSETLTDINDIKSTSKNPRIAIWKGDMTTLKADCIVNPANQELLGCFQPLHNCLDNLIHTKSGIQLRLYCNQLMEKQGHEEPVGKAKITPGFNLPCKYVIHTVGPTAYGRLQKEDEEELTSCYNSCLSLADSYHLTNIAFCCISTGVFCFPNQRAAEIAVSTVERFLKENNRIKKVIFNVYKDVDEQIYSSLLG